MQFKTQQGFRALFPQADFLLVLLRGQPVGQLILNRAREEFRLVDIALLAGHRSHGIGTSLLQHLQAEAAAAGRPLRLTVLKGHRAARLYRRLGFVPIAETELHQELQWPAALPQPPSRSRSSGS